MKAAQAIGSIISETSKPLIVAHRGSSAAAPENTLAAFQRAIEDGAEGIEFDVRLSKDGIPVVFHDTNLRRMAQMDHAVAALTAHELSLIDAGSWFNRIYPERADAGFARETVPTLAATLDFLKGYNGYVYIELKSADGEIEKTARAVCEVIKDSPIKEQLIVKSFRLMSIPIVRSMAPGVRTAALFAPKVMAILRKEKHLVKLAAEFGADELSIHYSLATKKLMRRAKRRGLPVTIWTADNPRWVKRAVRLGMKAIITNDPARLIKRRTEVLNSSS